MRIWLCNLVPSTKQVGALHGHTTVNNPKLEVTSAQSCCHGACMPVTHIPDPIYTAPCNGVIRHGAQIDILWVFANHARKNKHKTSASTIFALCCVLREFNLYA